MAVRLFDDGGITTKSALVAQWVRGKKILTELTQTREPGISKTLTQRKYEGEQLTKGSHEFDNERE